MDSEDEYIQQTEYQDKSDIHLLQQYVSEVLDFSSQYGSDISMSYTACNIVGKPSKFPNYGDFPQTFLFRTYGTWWTEAPSHQTEYMPQNRQKIEAEDYVDLLFEHAVYPWQIYIYETYNPGAVVRIWCYRNNGHWLLLWEHTPVLIHPISRAFCPAINMTDFPTNLIRLEFNQSLLDYHTAIDAVMLVGSLIPIPSLHDKVPENSLMKQICTLGIKAIHKTETSHIEQKFLKVLLKETRKKIAEQAMSPPSGSFSVLPDETIIKIFGYLDLLSLTRCTVVNKRFNELATDALLYTSISLKPYWYRADRSTLRSFSKRSTYLQKLDLSWCGAQDTISATDFVQFIRQCGTHMTHIKLNCCKFVNSQCLKEISKQCNNLKELCLRNCNNISQSGFSSVGELSKLERLDLYRSSIEGPSLITILRANPNMRHLNVGACGHIAAMDDVAFALSSHNQNLISVDFWKSYSLSPLGVQALGNCHQIEELDIGWCLGVGIPGDSLLHLAKNCLNIKRLILAALRGLTDYELKPVLELCTKLQHLDLLGLQGITAVSVETALNICKDLKLLDISFCEQILDESIEVWHQQYPAVNIKRSFQADMRNELQTVV